MAKAISLPEEIMSDLTSICGGEPSDKLKSVVSAYLRAKHSIQGVDPRPNWDVIAMAAAIIRDVALDRMPRCDNPFRDCPYGTPLEVLRVDSKEVYCVGFWMAVGEGVNEALVQVAMHDSEEEAGWFPYDQIRLRDEPVAPQPPEQGPIRVIPDPPAAAVEAEVAHELERPAEAVSASQPDKFDDEELPETEDQDVRPEDAFVNPWESVDPDTAVWMEDGSEGIFRGVETVTGRLMVSVKGKHPGAKYSLYLPDQVRKAVEIPVEHDPVDVGYGEMPEPKVNPYSLVGK